MISNKILIISFSAMTRKAIKDIIEYKGIKYQAILQDEPYKGAVEVNLKEPRAIILDGDVGEDKNTVYFVKVMSRLKPEIPIIFFSEYAHICNEARKAGAVKRMARPRLRDNEWMSKWSEELLNALETIVQ